MSDLYWNTDFLTGGTGKHQNTKQIYFSVFMRTLVLEVKDPSKNCMKLRQRKELKNHAVIGIYKAAQIWKGF